MVPGTVRSSRSVTTARSDFIQYGTSFYGVVVKQRYGRCVRVFGYGPYGRTVGLYRERGSTMDFSSCGTGTRSRRIRLRTVPVPSHPAYIYGDWTRESRVLVLCIVSQFIHVCMLDVLNDVRFSDLRHVRFSDLRHCHVKLIFLL